MNSLLTHIDSLAALSVILPPILKAGLIILICLVAYLPLSFLAWILSLSFTKAFEKLEAALMHLSERALRTSIRFRLRAKYILEKHYTLNTTFVSFEDVKYQFSGHSVQTALDNFSTSLDQAPAMALDREAAKTKLVEQVNQNLENLEGGMESLQNIDIPELELDKGQVIRKKSALSSLFLFIPLLIAVVIVNTSLLNTFFDELMDGDEIFDGLPYSIVIALMFTFIELGAGVAMGFQEREQDGLKFSSGNYILSTFCWLIVLGLAIIEFALYLLVGTMQVYDDYRELIDAAYSDGFIIIAASGGWMAILGPCIVLALYVFGHRVSTGYFDYSKENDFEMFKNELDDRFNIYQSMRAGIDEISEKITDLVKSIRTENIALNKVKGDGNKALEHFKQEIDNQKTAISAAVTDAEKLVIPAPEIQVQKLSLEDSKSFHRANIVYLIVLLSSLVVTAFCLPNAFNIASLMISGFASNLIVALLFISLSILAGMILSTKVNIVSTTDGQLGKVILEKHSPLNLTASIIILAINVSLVCLMFSQTGIIKNLIPLIFCLLSFWGAFFAGRKLVQAIGSWYVSLASLWLNAKSLFTILLSVLVMLCAKIFALVMPVLDSLSFPIRFVFRRA